MKPGTTPQEANGGCACCANPVRDAVAASATRLGLDGQDRQALLASVDAGDCRSTRDLMAAQVGTRLAAAQDQVRESISATAATHLAVNDADPGMPPAVVEGHHDTVTALAALATLQAAAVRLTHQPGSAGCTAHCPCATAGTEPEQDGANEGFVLAAASHGGPPIACTLDGGIEAMRTRIADWQRVIEQAKRRQPVDGGVTLAYEHDERLTVELARLAAAEFACCSFFTFALTVSPNGVAFTVTAPPEAGDVVTAMFGAYGPAGTP